MGVFAGRARYKAYSIQDRGALRGLSSRSMANMRRVVCAVLLMAGVTGVFAADVQIMSGGALEAGLTTVLEQYKRATDTPQTDVQIQFGTGPQLVGRLAEGVVADVLIAP